MLIPLQDALKPYANLKLQHRGYVVVNDDPLNIGRVKCKIPGLIESSDTSRLPWCYPKESTSRGGRPDSGSSAVPPLNTMVMIEFPAGGDAPVGGGSPYYPVWVGMARMNLSNPGIGVSVGWSEDGGLSTPYGTGTTKSSDIETNVWVKTQSQNVSWSRVDKSRGSWEFYDQDSGAAIRIDRGGHVQMQVTSLDVVTSSDVRFKVGGNFEAEVKGATFFDVGADMGIKTGGAYTIQAAGDIDVQSAKAVGIQAATTIGNRAGTDFGVDASANVAIKAGADITLQAGAGIALVGGGTVSEKAALCARDAAEITDNGGASQGPLSTPPARLGTVDAVTNNLNGATAYINDRASALASIVSAMTNEASNLKQSGQQVLNKVKDWAAAIIGANI